jgi:hypothetical protein
MAHFIRKWGSWIENDENCFPIVQKKYDIGFVVKNCPPQMIGNLEPWCSTIYCDGNTEDFIRQVQPGTPFDMRRRVKPITDKPTNNIVVYFDASQLVTDERFKFITSILKILTNSGEVGVMEYDIFKIEIKSMESYEKELVDNNSSYYTKQLLPIPTSDPYCTDALFKVFDVIKDKE